MHLSPFGVDGRMDGRTDGQKGGQKNVLAYGQAHGHIIMSIRGFEPVACSHMRHTQLWAARMIAKISADD